MHNDSSPPNPLTYKIRATLDRLLELAADAEPGEAVDRSQLLALLQLQAAAVEAVEQGIQQRTLQLQQASEHQAMLRRIGDHVRDSLDENQILQTVVQELGFVLSLSACDATLYDDHQNATIVHRYDESGDSPVADPSMLSIVRSLQQQHEQGEQHPDLRQEQWSHAQQFCAIDRSQQQLILLCPILDNQTRLGDLLLYRPAQSAFSELETDLAQQVASQCAIAIRQARLYQTSRSQVAELERLNQVKDEFLNTISYELRVPMSNMKMAAQMLRIALNREQVGLAQPDGAQFSSKALRYLQILQNECDREARLIEDLLDLQQLDTNTMSLLVSAVPLNDFLPYVIEPFLQKYQAQDLQLLLQVEPGLQPLICDHLSLSRILTELLTNAYKYTPAHETVIIGAKSIDNQSDVTELYVSNTGIEIPPEHLTHIFEKFYRVPKLDVRQEGGTGLGLALVDKLVARLGGTIAVKSEDLKTCFTVHLPISQTTD